MASPHIKVHDFDQLELKIKEIVNNKKVRGLLFSLLIARQFGFEQTWECSRLPRCQDNVNGASRTKPKRRLIH